METELYKINQRKIELEKAFELATSEKSKIDISNKFLMEKYRFDCINRKIKQLKRQFEEINNK